MMNWNETELLWFAGKPILNASVPLITEGMALVGAFEMGVPKVTPATGSASDAFIGFATGPRRSFASDFRVDQITVPAVAPFTVLLGKLATVDGNGNGIGVYAANGGQLASGNGAAAGGANGNANVSTDPVTGLTLLTFDSSFAGMAFTAAYRFVMSAQEETSTYGTPNPGFPAEQILGQVEVQLLGKHSTNMVDPQANWYASGGPLVKAVAGGLLTDAGNAKPGIVLNNVRIDRLPTPSNPFLLLDVR